MKSAIVAVLLLCLTWHSNAGYGAEPKTLKAIVDECQADLDCEVAVLGILQRMDVEAPELALLRFMDKECASVYEQCALEALRISEKTADVILQAPRVQRIQNYIDGKTKPTPQSGR